MLKPGVFDYIEGDAILWERELLQRLPRDGQLQAYRHHGFWEPMDTLRDRMYLEGLWEASEAPWKRW